MFRSIRTVVAAALLAVASVSAVAAGEADAGHTSIKASAACTNPDTVSFAHVASPVFAPSYFVPDLGLDSTYCLKIDDKILAASPTILQGVASGQYNVGYATAGAIMQAISQGVDLKVLWPAELARAGSNGIFVKADSPIRTLKDLEGKTVALLGLNSNIQAAVVERLGRAKVDVRKVNLIAYPFPQMLNGILSGRIDAGHLAEPYVAIGGNQVRMLFPTWTIFGKNPPIVYVVANGKWARDNPDVLQRFYQAYGRGILASIGNREKVIDYTLKQDSSLSRDLLEKQFLPAFSLNYGFDSLHNQIKRMIKLGMMSKEPNYYQVFLFAKPTAGNDIINGANKADSLSGLGGNDIILGYEGNDQLAGGPGNDTIEAGLGRDVVSAGPGNDIISAIDKQADVIDCGAGRDVAYVDQKDTVRGCEVVRRTVPTNLLVSLGVVIK